MESNEKMISLKEASKISGYAPDYIGQLIRKGKLKGRQVHFNVAWMTTEDAVMEYMRSNSEDSTKASTPFTVNYFAKETYRMFVGYIESTRPLRLILYVTIVLTVIFTLVLFYILSVIVDRALNDKALQSVESSYQQQQ